MKILWKERKSVFTKCHQKRALIIDVLDTKSQNIPEVVVVRRGAGGVLGIWEGRVNWVKGSKWGQFTSSLRGRWTIPVTAGGCQVSGRGHKGEAKGSWQGEQGELRHVYM